MGATQAHARCIARPFVNPFLVRHRFDRVIDVDHRRRCSRARGPARRGRAGGDAEASRETQSYHRTICCAPLLIVVLLVVLLARPPPLLPVLLRNGARPCPLNLGNVIHLARPRSLIGASIPIACTPALQSVRILLPVLLLIALLFLHLNVLGRLPLPLGLRVLTLPHRPTHAPLIQMRRHVRQRDAEENPQAHQVLRGRQVVTLAEDTVHACGEKAAVPVLLRHLVRWCPPRRCDCAGGPCVRTAHDSVARLCKRELWHRLKPRAALDDANGCPLHVRVHVRVLGAQVAAHEHIGLLEVLREEHKQILGRDEPVELLPPKRRANLPDARLHLHRGHRVRCLLLRLPDHLLGRLAGLGGLDRCRLALRVV